MVLEKELTREEQGKLIKDIVKGDSQAFDIFCKQYGKIVENFAGKFYLALKYRTFNLMDYEDTLQEIWTYLIENMPKYDHKRSSIVTWLYLMCPYKPNRILRDFNAGIRKPEGGITYYEKNIDNDSDRSNKDITYLDMLIDPKGAIEDQIVSDNFLYEYIYILKEFVSSLKEVQQVVYIHAIKGLSQNQSSSIINISQAQISRYRMKIYDKLLKFKKNFNKYDINKSKDFTIKLLSKKDDDELAVELECKLAVIKICREVLFLTDIYDDSQGGVV